jgi:hypothetical protein
LDGANKLDESSESQSEGRPLTQLEVLSAVCEWYPGYTLEKIEEELSWEQVRELYKEREKRRISEEYQRTDLIYLAAVTAVNCSIGANFGGGEIPRELGLYNRLIEGTEKKIIHYIEGARDISEIM